MLAEPHGFKLLSQSKVNSEILTVQLHPYRILRGQLFTNEGSTSYKRKSCLLMTHAMPTDKCDDIFIDIVGKGNMGGYFEREDCNNVHLESEIAIDLARLQFLSTNTEIDDAVLNQDVFDEKNKEGKEIWENYYTTPFPTKNMYFNHVKNGNAFQYQRSFMFIQKL